MLKFSFVNLEMPKDQVLLFGFSKLHFIHSVLFSLIGTNKSLVHSIGIFKFQNL